MSRFQGRGVASISEVGVGRRRRWTYEAKGRIVGEPYAPGSVVSEVARRHDMSPQQLFTWRRAERAGRFNLPADDMPMFVPVVSSIGHRPASAKAAEGAGVITIEIASALVRVERSVDPVWLVEVLRSVEGCGVTTVPAGVRVLIKPIDFRKGGDALTARSRRHLDMTRFWHNLHLIAAMYRLGRGLDGRASARISMWPERTKRVRSGWLLTRSTVQFHVAKCQLGAAGAA